MRVLLFVPSVPFSGRVPVASLILEFLSALTVRAASVWDRFTGASVVFVHPDPAMTPAVREESFYRTSLELLSLPRILRHTLRIPRAGFPTTHVLSMMKALPVRRAMRRAFAEWQASTKCPFAAEKERS